MFIENLVSYSSFSTKFSNGELPKRRTINYAILHRKGSEFPQLYWIMGVAWFVVFIAIGIVFVQQGKNVSLSPALSEGGGFGAGFYLRVAGFLVILIGIGILIWAVWKKVYADEEKKK